MHRLLSTLALLASAVAAHADCGPDVLGTSRVIQMPRAGDAWGGRQHAALPLLGPREVAITFDDGPRAGPTPVVLEALAAQCVKATFFMVGEAVEREPGLARRVRDAGHSIGGHGHVHRRLDELPPEAQQADLDRLRITLQRELQVNLAAYRFPYLAETPTLRRALVDARITVMSIDMSVDDWLPNQTPELLVGRLIDRLKNADTAQAGVILLLHEFDVTANALPTLLTTLRQFGYRVVQLRWE